MKILQTVMAFVLAVAMTGCATIAPGSLDSKTAFERSSGSPQPPQQPPPQQPPPEQPPPPPTGTYSGSGPVASWKAYQYRDTDNQYHQAIDISGAKAAYPVIGYSYSDAGCTNLGDTFNDFWQPIGNGFYWFINRPELVYVKWVWYDNATSQYVLQQTPCLDYRGAPKDN